MLLALATWEKSSGRNSDCALPRLSDIYRATSSVLAPNAGERLSVAAHRSDTSTSLQPLSAESKAQAVDSKEYGFWDYNL